MATAYMFGNFLLNALEKEIHWVNDDVKVALMADTYTPSQDNNDYWNDVSAHEISGIGYSTGGAAINNKTITYTGGTNKIKLDGENVQWTSSTITARYAVVYDDEPALAADKILLGYIDFGGNVSSTNGTFEITFDAGGIFEITVT